MVALARTTYISPQDYLDWERKQEETHEYHDGVIVAMSGGTPAHAIIIGNLIRRLGNQLDKQPCATTGGNLRVYVEKCNRYFYPDVMVVCGAPNLVNNHRDMIDNPTIVVEVLSDSTEHTDRTIKLDCYWALGSVKTYLVVSQYEFRIEKFTKIKGKNRWELTVYNTPEDLIQLPEIDGELRADEVYERISFEPVARAESAIETIAQ